MKRSLKKLGLNLTGNGVKPKHWKIEDELLFCSEPLEPRVLLSALAVDDQAVVQEDAVFDSTVDTLNGDATNLDVTDNDMDIAGDGGPNTLPVAAVSSTVNGLQGALGLASTDPQALNFSSNGEFTFDGTQSDVIQALSLGETETFNFDYQYIGSGSTARVQLNVQGANDVFEVEFGGPDYEYVVNGNAVEFTDPLAQLTDIDANDTYQVVLTVGQTNPLHTGPLGSLFLESDGDADAGQTLIIEGSLDEVNAELLEVRFKPANVDYTDDFDPAKIAQQIDISVTEFAGGFIDAGTTETSTAVISPVLDVDGEVVFNQYPETTNDAIAFNENGFVDIESGNLLSNDSDPEGDPISIDEVRFGDQVAVENVNSINGVDFTHELEGDFGTLFFNLDGTFAYEFDDDVEFLGSGEQVQDVFEYDIIDSAWNVSKTPGELTVNIAGTNDAPEFVEIDHDETIDGLTSEAIFSASQELTEQTNLVPLEVDFAAAFNDVDVNDTHEVVVDGVYLIGDVPPGAISGDFETSGTYFDLLTAGDPALGNVPLSFAAQAADLNYLDGGDTLTLVYKIILTDSHDESTASLVKIEITGTEDSPLLWVDDKGDVVEGDPGDDPITTTGALAVTGIDQNDNFSFADNGSLDGTYGVLTISDDGTSWEYTLNNDDPIVQMLNEGEVVHDVFTLFVFDENGNPEPLLDENGDPVTDDNGDIVFLSREVEICITGTDDAPVSVAEVVKVSEGDIGSPTFIEGVISISDIDSGDNPTFVTNELQPGSGTGTGTYGAIVETVLVENPDFDYGGDGTEPEFLEVFRYELDQTLVQQLAKDEILIDTVVLTAFDFSQLDEHGDVIVRESGQQEVTIEIKGTNDVQVITSDSVELWEDNDPDTTGVGLQASGTLDVFDVDLLDEIFVAASGVSTNLLQSDSSGEYEEVPFWRDIDAYDAVSVQDGDGNPDEEAIETLLGYLTLPTDAVIISGEDTGVVQWSFDSGDQGFDFLAYGERLEISFDVVATDLHGAEVLTTILVSISGKNDSPDIFVGPQDSSEFTAKENFGILEGGGYLASGTLSVTDPDASDFVTASEQFGQGVIGVEVDSTFPIPPDTGLTNEDFLSYLSLNNPDTVVGVSETTGILEWSFDTNGEDFDFLAKGETLTLTYTVGVTDHHDPEGTDTQEIVVTINGTNDSPELKSGDVPFSLTNGHSGFAENAIDANDFFNNGTLVADLIQDQQEDVDVNGSLQGIAVQSLGFDLTATGNESWEYSVDGGATWIAFDVDTSPENATVLDTSARVRFVPDSGGENTGWARLKFVFWDQTDGNPSGTTGVDSTPSLSFDDLGDPHGESAYGDTMLYFTVAIESPAADGPTAVADNFDVQAGSTTVLGSLLANDLDPDTANSDLTASLLGDSDNVIIFADGTFQFDASGLLPGQSASFQYVVSDNSSSDIGVVTINVIDAEVTIDGPSFAVVGKGETFTATAPSIGPLVSEVWSVDGVAVSSDSVFDFIPTETGEFTITYTATDVDGAVASSSITVSAVPFAIIDGDLVIGGTTGDDDITVSVVGDNYRVNVNGEFGEFAIADVTGEIIICGDDGDDNITVAVAVNAATQIFAGAGNDVVRGGGGNDFIEAGLGDDDVSGRAGDDRVLGEDGNDTLRGGAGDDLLFGGAGDDIATGGDGSDQLRGDEGDDTLRGNIGNDLVFGGVGDDTLSGGLGQDEVFGMDGDDEIRGDAGADILSGGNGNDILNGGAGNDDIAGNAGDDTIRGNTGNDTIDGGAGDDFISGGDGDDVLNGQNGDDEVFGNFGNDHVSGNAGDDTLSGGLGDDEIFGGDDDDLITGNAGDDMLTGGLGIDVLDGGGGFDVSVDVGETEIRIEL